MPAAFLGCGSRFSGSLSGIEPWFPVTRYNHGRHLTYHRQLIRQTLERYVAGSEAMRSATVIQSHHIAKDRHTKVAKSIGLGLINALLPVSRSKLFGMY